MLKQAPTVICIRLNAAFLLFISLFAACSCHSRTSHKESIEQSRYSGNPEKATQSINRLRNHDLQQAVNQAREAFLFYSVHPHPKWSWSFRLLYAEVLLQQDNPKEAGKLLESEPPAGPDEAEWRARLALNRGHMSAELGDYQNATRLFQEACERALALKDPSLSAEALERRAGMFIKDEQMSKASELSSQAIAFAEAGHNNYLLTSGLAQYGAILLRQSRFDQAIPKFERALDIAKREQLDTLLGPLMGDLASCYYYDGDTERALDYLEAVQQVYQRTGQLLNKEIDLGTLGNVHQLLQHYDKAVKSYREALEIADIVGETYWKVRWSVRLASVYLDIGDLSSAEKANNHALAIGIKKEESVERGYAELNSVRIARRRGQFEAALTALQQLLKAEQERESDDAQLEWETHAELAELFSALGRIGDAQREFDAALERSESVRKTIKDEWLRLTFSARMLTLSRSYVDFLVDHGDWRAALLVAESARARLLAEKLGGQLSGPRALTDSQMARRKQAVILSYWIAPKRSFLWISAATADHFIQLPGESELTSLIKKHNSDIQNGSDVSHLITSAGGTLYRVLLEGARRETQPGTQVIIVPDGPLCDLNFETLADPSTARYMVETNPISIASSSKLLLPEKETGFRPKSLLLVGAAPSTDPDFPSLPEAGRELERIRNRFEGRAATVLLAGTDATPERFRKADPRRFDLIHFAAHALANRESPLDSAVILSSDGVASKIYAHDVQSMKLRARLVTLSACRSAGARALPGEGLVGLAWTFLSAGARGVIAGLWNVPDQATSDLMGRLYAHIDAGDSPSESLRFAKLELMKEANQFRKPYYWAGFQLYTR